VNRSIVLLAVLLARPALADDVAETKAEETAKKNDGLEIDYSVPEAPAFAFLGASPTQVSRPGSLRDLGADLVNAVGRDGSVQQGFALEVRPTPLFWAPSRKDAIAANPKYVLSRLHVSIGTQKTTSTANATMMTESPTDAAFGLRWTIIDHGDPWSDVTARKSIGDAILLCAPDRPDPSLDAPSAGEAVGTPPDAARNQAAAEPGEAKRDFSSCVKKAKEAYEDAHWNAFRVEVGFAGGARLPDSKLDDDAFWLGESLWAVSSFGICDVAEIAVSAKGSIRRDVDTGPSTKELALGARVFVGGNRFHLFGEAVGQLRKDSAGDAKDGDWGAGVEIKVIDKTWLALGVGNVLDDDEDVQLLANIRWVISDKERFTRPD
jgi:hypothetical protein